MKEPIYLLVDYRSHFYPSVRFWGASMDVNLLTRRFAELGFELRVKGFPDIDFRRANYKERHILYQSSQDRNLHYKSYIEDVMLGLHLQGANLIPDFPKLRAHHNKVFMEILRDLSASPDVKNIASKGYGTYEDFRKDLASYPGEIVIKPFSGSMSAKIRLLRTDREKRRYPAVLSRTPHPVEYAKNFANMLYRKHHVWKSTHRRKFIIQNYVPGLRGDYKILVFFDKYYVLYRENRKNDFRASGSGRLTFVEDLPEGLLDFAQRVFVAFDTPFASFDIASSSGQFFLLEFQFVYFGMYAIERSSYFFRQSGNTWALIREKPDLEKEFATSVARHIMNRRIGDGGTRGPS